MNSFVNPNKRGVTLPSGCKDLVDVLRHSERKHTTAIQAFIRLLLLQAQQDDATELVIGATPAGRNTPIRYKVESTWHDISPFPSHLRPDVIAEFARMAKLSTGQFPSEGVLDISVGDVRLRWMVGMTSADGDCTLTRVHD